MTRMWADVRAALGVDEPTPARPATGASRPAGTTRPARPPAKRPAHAPGRAPRVPFALLVVTLVAGGLGLLLLLNTASAANEVRRHDLAAQDASISAQLQELQNEVAASAAPGNLARAAAQLGMVPAGAPAFLVINSDGSVKVMGHPQPASDAALANIPGTKTAHRSAPKPTSTSASRSAGRSASTAAGTATSTSPAAGRNRRGGRATAAGARPTPPSAPPSPTPTPTPTLVLPGGNR